MHDEQNVDLLQRSVASIANLGMKLGFHLDPGAKRLFDFAQWCEQEHGRPNVSACILEHNAILDGSVMGVLESLIIPRLTPLGAAELQEVQRVRRHMLEMLCAMANLEDPRPLPPLRTLESLREHFEDAIIPGEFTLLAGLTCGDPSSFAALENKDTFAAPTKRSLRRRVLDRITPEKLVPPAPQDAIAPRRIFAKDPALAFLSSSYLFFLQTYATRALVEGLPEMISAINQFEAAQSNGPEDDDDFTTGQIVDMV